jgi:hypothetical protein
MYSPEQIEAVCDELLDWLVSGESVVRFCREKEEDLADSERLRKAIYAELAKNEKLADNYARAKAAGIEARIDAARETARTEPDVARARLITDIDKWEASKLLPKKYGEKQQIEHSGEVKTTPDMDEEAIRIAYAALQRRDEKVSG